MQIKFSRASGRKDDQLRNVEIIPDYLFNADGSCLIKVGNTQVVCSATIENRVPPFLRNQGTGWVTAEYSMLPASADSRIRREVSNGKISGRTAEIQRLISRSLRAALDLKKLGEIQITIDCDVINADGGTRTAAITGGYVAMVRAINTKLITAGLIRQNPIIRQISAISCGLQHGRPILDLDYLEDSNIDVDSNFVLSSDGQMIEVQSTAENGNIFLEQDLVKMLHCARKGCEELFLLQQKFC